ncbi:pentatricopeptide repeat-containing protein At1g73710 [Magnolia sinica]|uniref:pentatricopeptide repeat-containing protein At1g73710 n=1 Tax=Magnolia sinica TaxID=86752 RepID=UPI00265AB46E|nr:pentatricopeptide repeat-containing protein At1g73710 [Magnolia sinica]
MLRHCSTRELGHENFQNPTFSPGKLRSPLFPPSLSQQSRVFLGFKLNSHANPFISAQQSSRSNSSRKRNEGSPPSISRAFEIQADAGKTQKSSVSSGFQSHSLPSANAVSLPVKASGSNRKKRYGGSLPLFFRDLEREGDIEITLESWIGKLTPKEQTVILKEQRDWRSALRVFRWMKLQRDYIPNVIHYNVVLRILGRAQKWDELRLCWIEMAKDGVFPTNNTYGMLVDVYGKAGLVKEAILWLKHMKIRGIFPDEVTMNTVVRILKDAGEFDRGERFFKDWCSGRVELGILDFDSVDLDPGLNPISPKHFLLTELFKAGGRAPPTNVPSVDEGSVRKPRLAATYNTLIDLYGKAGRLKDASDAFAEMLRSGVAPDTFTFNTMINICGSHGHLSEAESLLAKMEERGVPPDTKSFNIFLSLYGDMGNIDRVLTCYKKIKEVGLCPDAVTYRAILHILCERKRVPEVEDIIKEMEKSGLCVDEQSLPVVMKMYVKEGLLDQAMIFLEKHCTGRRISSKTYAAIIDSYAEMGLWAEAEAVFFEKSDLGHKKDVTEHNVMIKAYGKAKLYDKALSLFGSMRSNGIWPDECTYNSLIQMLSGGELIDSARDLLAKMQEAGFKPRCATFSAVIASNVRSGMISEAVDVYEEMMRVGVRPNEVVYGSLINAFAEAGKVEEALHYFHTMEESGLTANQIIYTSLIKAYSKVGLWEKAQELYGKMKNLEGGPDVVASNSMIDLYADLGMVYEAKSIFDRLRENGNADGVSFATMMYLYKSMGRLDEAIDVAQEMQQSGLLTDCASFSNVMASYADNGQLRECGELLHQMITRRILPDFATFKVMFMVLKKGGIPVEAVTQLEKSYEDGKPYARQAIITLMFSVLGLHAWALESCETFTKADTGLDSSSYNVAIYAFGASGDVDKALNMYMRMQDEGLKPDLVTYINLVRCYGKAGLMEGVKRVYSQMNFGEIELNESLFEAVIDACKVVGRHDLAELVSQEMRFSFNLQDHHDSHIEDDESSAELSDG